MAQLVKIVSFDCRGLPKLASKLWEKTTVNSLLHDCENDIIYLQETFYSKQELSCLNSLHSDFWAVGPLQLMLETV